MEKVDMNYSFFSGKEPTDDNACVLLNNAGELRGSRIFGPGQ